MMRLAHASDVHLDHLTGEPEVVAFAKKVVDTGCAALLLSGDISQAKAIVPHLLILEREIQRPIYFVCGNHDFYGGSITEVRKTLKDLTNSSQFLRYLPTIPCVPMSNDTAIVGHDGFYDCGYGDVKQTTFLMNDWFSIAEFYPHSGGQAYANQYRVKDMKGIVEQAKKLAHEACQHVHDGIKQAVARKHTNIVIVTHFPPFAQACVYRGQPTGAGHLPWYSSKAMGDMLRAASTAFPKVKFTVFCGHTHGKCDVEPWPNVKCYVAGAEYGKPTVNVVIDAP